MISFREGVSRTPWLTIAVALAVVCSAANSVLNGSLGNDTASYYTRMASQFGQGNYARAFFHAIPPLVPTLAGVLCRLGLDSWQAMKLVSGLFFVLSVYWSYRLARLRLAPEEAQWCALMYVCCSRLLRYGMAGQLEGAKMFFVLLAFEQLLLFIRHHRWVHLLVASSGFSLLALSRNEGIISLPLGCLLLFVLAPETNAPETARVPTMKRMADGVLPCVVMLGVCLVLCSPWIHYQYRLTGRPSISSKLTVVTERLLHLDESRLTAAVEGHKQRIAQLHLPPPEPRPVETRSLWRRFRDSKIGTVPFKLIATYRGLIPHFFFPALVGVWLVARRREWTVMDTAFAVTFVGHLTLLLGFAPSIVKRLVTPYVPFYFVWFVVAASALLGYVNGRVSDRVRLVLRKALPLVLTVPMGVMLLDGMSGVRKTLRGKVAIEHEIAEWVLAERHALDIDRCEPLPSDLTPWGYHNGSGLVVASVSPQVSSLADVDWCTVKAYPGELMEHSKVVQVLRHDHVDIILVDKEFRKYFPRFRVDSNDTRIVSDRWSERGVQIMCLEPEVETTADCSSMAPPLYSLDAAWQER